LVKTGLIFSYHYTPLIWVGGTLDLAQYSAGRKRAKQGKEDDAGDCGKSDSCLHAIGLRGKKNLIRCIYTLIVAIGRESVLVVGMITARQIRAARALLGWSQQQLADKAIVSLNALARLEKGAVDSRISTVLSIQKALAKAGVEFLEADQKGEGVRLKSPRAWSKLSRMQWQREEPVLIGCGGWVDDWGTPVAIAGGNKHRRQVIAKKCYFSSMSAIGDA
jgi:transcriptional regulator with XRE-family HTH domain